MSAGQITAGARVLAKFQPKRVDDLSPEASPLVGRVGVFEALYVIKEVYEDGSYDGEWAMQIPRDWPCRTFNWVPESDLMREDGPRA